MLSFLSIVILSLAIAQHPGPQQEGASQSYLLLNDGQVIEGVVEQDSDGFWVTKKSGSRIVFSPNKIATVAKNMSDIYWAKYGQLAVSDQLEHKALFRWCIKNGLIKEAKNQLDVVQSLAVEHHDLIQMQNLMVTTVERHRAQLLNDSTTLATTATKVDPANSEETKTDRQVKQASFESSLDLRKKDAMRRAQHASELKSMTKHMPGFSVVMFKRKIQPILIRSCYQCHDKDATQLPLMIAGKGLPVPKRMSQENLYQVLKYTDINQPLDSQLLSAAALPHAGLEKPIIKIQSQQFQILRTWLISISAKPNNYHRLPQSFLESDLLVKTQQRRSAKNVEAELPERAAAKDSFAPIPKSDQQPPATNVESISVDVEEGDPFDPEKFNRTFLDESRDTTAEEKGTRSIK